ncbi:hypothetical protein Tco_0348272 [Tanacetum coccineum]
MTSPPHHHHSSTLQAPPSPPFMSFPYPIIILSYSDVEDALSSTNAPDYTPALSDYSPASPGSTSFNTSKRFN